MQYCRFLRGLNRTQQLTKFSDCIRISEDFAVHNISEVVLLRTRLKIGFLGVLLCLLTFVFAACGKKTVFEKADVSETETVSEIQTAAVDAVPVLTEPISEETVSETTTRRRTSNRQNNAQNATPTEEPLVDDTNGENGETAPPNADTPPDTEMPESPETPETPSEDTPQTPSEPSGETPSAEA